MTKRLLLLMVPVLLSAAPLPEMDRSPVDVLLTADGRHLFSANQTAGTVSWVRLSDGKLLAEVACGERPNSLALTPDGLTLLATATYSGEVLAYSIQDESLSKRQSRKVGFEPRGIVVTPDGRRAFVALASGSCVVELSLPELKEVRRIDVGRWPRELALSPDGSRLAVGVSGDGGVAVIDTVSGKKLFLEDFMGLNLGQMQTSRNGQFVYFPWTLYRQMPVTVSNIKQGWVLGSRIARVRLGEQSRREAITLDPQGEAVADPTGLALNADETRMYCTAAGSQELLIYRLADLPFQDFGNPDHIHNDLLKDRDRFDRVPLGGRPMKLRVGPDGLVYVANYLLNAVQVVDPVAKKVVRSIHLGGSAEQSLARQGEAIFYDGKRSLDQWYSCHSCHFEGGTNSVAMDTKNDGRFGNFKTVLSLRNVAHTGPWTWHGWQTTLEQVITKSLTDSMLGKPPTNGDVKALTEYLGTLTPAANPHPRDEAVKRGEAIFRSDKAECSRCHSGPHFSDGRIHAVGLESRGDVYRGYNSPSLIGVFDRPLLLHDGRAKTLREVLNKHHNPKDIVGNGELTEAELNDLIAYLNSL